MPRQLKNISGLLAAVACGAAVTACGSSSNSGSGSAAVSNQQSAGIKYSQCMRAHGLPNFPDPNSSGGIQISAGSGVNPGSPVFQSAQRACAKLVPFGRPSRGPGSEARREALVKLAECMRSHGLTSFPDPTISSPSKSSQSSSSGGGGIAFGGAGGFISIPESLIQTPGFKQAAAACGFPGAGGHGPKPAGAGAGGAASAG